MLVIGALTNSNPVVDGLAGLHPSLDNFVTVLTNPERARRRWRTR